jgi:hypothetical protein
MSWKGRAGSTSMIENEHYFCWIFSGHHVDESVLSLTSLSPPPPRKYISPKKTQIKHLGKSQVKLSFLSWILHWIRRRNINKNHLFILVFQVALILINLNQATNSTESTTSAWKISLTRVLMKRMNCESNQRFRQWICCMYYKASNRSMVSIFRLKNH